MWDAALWSARRRLLRVSDTGGDELSEYELAALNGGAQLAAGGLQFARHLDRRLPCDDARVEIPLARAALNVRRGRCTPRRGACDAALVAEPRRVIVAGRLPALRPMHLTVRLGRN